MTSSSRSAALSSSEVSSSEVEPDVVESPVSEPLPAVTQAIVASAGSNGLYNPPRGAVRLMAISDLNGPYGSIDYDPEIDKALQLIPFWQPDLVVCSGDMVAGQSLSLTEERMKAMWAGFDEHVAAPLRQMEIPYGFTVGNHDASAARSANGSFVFQKEREITRDYWQAPEHDPGVEFIDRDDFPFYYTFKFDDIFFLAWDGSSHLIPEEKLAWVEQSLASEAAQNAKMRVLLGHLPLYSVAVGRNQPGEVMNNPERLQALLERYNVHTYISGHQHAYYPAHKGNLQLLHAGLLGSGPRPLIDSNLPPRKTLTLIDVNFDSPELTTYTTYDMQTLALVQNEQLPQLIVGHNGVVLRRDVEWDELNTAEKSRCEQRLGREKCQA
ncbi:MAG: metallophosphoesterase [Elainellaceae cyanobacterium]